MREITLNKKGVLNMKPDYKNWIPKGMLVSLIAGTVLSLALLLVFGAFGAVSYTHRDVYKRQGDEENLRRAADEGGRHCKGLVL